VLDFFQESRVSLRDFFLPMVERVGPGDSHDRSFWSSHSIGI
jgi:hypothetical protein